MGCGERKRERLFCARGKYPRWGDPKGSACLKAKSSRSFLREEEGDWRCVLFEAIKRRKKNRQGAI